MLNQFEKINLFVNELNDIRDIKLRSFAIQLLLNAPEYFYTVPASSSGKYHPYFAKDEQGLIKHTRCVVFFAECNAESFNFDVHSKDLIIIAAIAHDIKKQGNNSYGKHTVWEHPELAHDYILEMQIKYPELITIEDATIIADAVLCHMGKWAHLPEYIKKKKQYPLPNSLFEYALQSADYMASRSELIGFDFRNTDNIELKDNDKILIIENNSKSNDIGEEVFKFGKHCGKTIKEVVKNHFDYIDWMVNKSDFKNKDMVDKIKLYLESRKEVS